MLLACVAVYLIFLAIPGCVIIWAALIAAKHGDRGETENDFERVSDQELNLLAQLVEFK